jgi:hypothetical protein
MTPHERHGYAVRRTYADIGLSAEQRERHKRRLNEATRRRNTSRFPAAPAELIAIGAAALLIAISFVVWQSLDPHSNEPAMTSYARDAAATERQRAIPFPPPETCPARVWSGPENRLSGQYPGNPPDQDGWSYSYFLDGSGISLNTWLGLLYEGENTVYWLQRTYQPQDIVYNAARLDGESAPATFRFDERSTIPDDNEGQNLIVQRATITFPTPGCWRITVSAQDTSLRQTVYVYPAGTREPDDTPAP